MNRIPDPARTAAILPAPGRDDGPVRRHVQTSTTAVRGARTRSVNTTPGILVPAKSPTAAAIWNALAADGARPKARTAARATRKKQPKATSTYALASSATTTGQSPKRLAATRDARRDAWQCLKISYDATTEKTKKTDWAALM